jgi:hypothetical protein
MVFSATRGVLQSSFVVEFVSELGEWNRFISHQDRNAIDNWINHLAGSRCQAAVERLYENPSGSISQSPAANDRINFPNERVASEREGGAIVGTTQSGENFRSQHETFLASKHPESRGIAAGRQLSLMDFAAKFKGPTPDWCDWCDNLCVSLAVLRELMMQPRPCRYF